MAIVINYVHVSLATVVKEKRKINKSGMFMSGNKLCLLSAQKCTRWHLKVLSRLTLAPKDVNSVTIPQNVELRVACNLQFVRGGVGIGCFYGKQWTQFGLD